MKDLFILFLCTLLFFYILQFIKNCFVQEKKDQKINEEEKETTIEGMDADVVNAQANILQSQEQEGTEWGPVIFITLIVLVISAGIISAIWWFVLREKPVPTPEPGTTVDTAAAPEPIIDTTAVDTTAVDTTAVDTPAVDTDTAAEPETISGHDNLVNSITDILQNNLTSKK